MKTAVDSSVLLDVPRADTRFGERSREALSPEAAALAGRLWRGSRVTRQLARDLVVADFLIGAHAAQPLPRHNTPGLGGQPEMERSTGM
jgi:NAD-dependent oxidoreductase involved in siderophore biosynthesis